MGGKGRFYALVPKAWVVRNMKANVQMGECCTDHVLFWEGWDARVTSNPSVVQASQGPPR